MTPPLRILLTGFEPFGGSPVNPSQLLVGSLAAAGVSGLEIHTAVLPVVGGAEAGSAWAALRSALARTKPHAVVCFGEAHTRGQISIERVAINLCDYRVPDNAGVTVANEPVVTDAPAAHFATLPVDAMCRAVLGAGVPCDLSLSAGAFLCNEIMFRILQHAAESGEPQWAGFVHVPQLPEQAAQRAGGARPMALAQMERAATAMLLAIAAHHATPKTTAGRRDP